MFDLSAKMELAKAVSGLLLEMLEVVSPWLMTNHRRRRPEGQLQSKLGTLQET